MTILQRNEKLSISSCESFYPFPTPLPCFPGENLQGRLRSFRMTGSHHIRFEASWTGDLDKIKALTLASWDPENNEPPLQIAVKDSNSSPFSLAYFRGHHDVAKSILEIAQAQYAVEEESSKRYRMQDDDSIESEDNRSEPDIYGEIVDQQTTIENVGQVSMQVKSHIKPLDMLDWEMSTIKIEDGKAEELTKSSCCLLRYVILNNDRKGLAYYYDLVVYFVSLDKQADDNIRPDIFPQWAFRLAVQRGHLEILTDMIRWTGAGLPLEDLMQKTDVEPKEAIHSYQGLTVYGNKRYDSRYSQCPGLTDNEIQERLGEGKPTFHFTI